MKKIRKFAALFLSLCMFMSATTPVLAEEIDQTELYENEIRWIGENSEKADTAGTVRIDKKNFPDDNFRAYVQRLDGAEDNLFTKNELAKITKIYCSEMGISDLTGIEHFTALTYLDCGTNKLTQLDVSKNTELTALHCYENQLTKLDVSQNKKLEYFDCGVNQLRSLDVSENALLKFLDCGDNRLTNVDVSKNLRLMDIRCNDNQLANLDLSKNTELTYLNCGCNNLTKLNISRNTGLNYFYCYHNQLTNLDISRNTALMYLDCSYNRLTNIDVSGNTQLKGFACRENQRQISNNTPLSAMPGFVAAKARNVKGGSFTDGKVVFSKNSSKIQYAYDCGRGQSAVFVLNRDRTGEMPGVVVPEKPHKITNVVSGVHVYWKAVEGTTKYGLWRSETGKDGTYKWIANPTVPHFTDTSVQSGKTYYYKVTTMNTATGKHSEKSEPIGITYIATPDLTSRKNTAAGVEMGWNKIPGATGYAIYRKSYDGGDAWARVATINGNDTLTWTDASVKNNNGTIYKYTIRALAGNTLSGCRATGRTMVRLSSQVLKSAVKSSATAIKCNWTTSSRVTGYEVRFMIGDKVYKTYTVGNYKTGTKTFTGLKSGQEYTVQVRTYKRVDGVGSFYSDWSTAKTVKL